MKKGLIVFSIVALFMIASCAMGQNQSDQQQADTVEILQADLSAPTETALFDPVKLSVRLTYGSEVVTDASEVDFEIWRNGDRDSGIITAAEETDSGVYTLETSFEEDGIYHVQANVTAAGSQVMPTQRIIAGDVSETELEAAEQASQQELEDEQDADS
ncbi:FixH family protein [Alkalicoccobacillus porphyridii]|uniref:YtkA-like domain-containing protein n=1 Tax=Alkalicoccobacillus porphyridii TaxID=2597270 RepID=A0A553ZV72_9BACI|nr:FixH family protein [Alkalicoccobacillus porphyridii]TSB45323.1 hypothetical protein FN960_16620 [Alkalicoccobacillus porphyridii]